jgi:acetyl-CoA acetyltransferase
VHAQEPEWFATAPVGATQKALAKAGWSVADVDLWEVNEAFAVVPMALMHELKVPHDIVNVNGGACALGHPIGASGARIMVTLIHALKARGLKKAWPRCASAAARRPPWRWSWYEFDSLAETGARVIATAAMTTRPAWPGAGARCARV